MASTHLFIGRCDYYVVVPTSTLYQFLQAAHNFVCIVQDQEIIDDSAASLHVLQSAAHALKTSATLPPEYGGEFMDAVAHGADFSQDYINGCLRSANVDIYIDWDGNIVRPSSVARRIEDDDDLLHYATVVCVEDSKRHDTSCIICLREYPTGHEVLQLRCGHAFCPHCIMQWWTMKRSCPIRCVQIRTEGSHQ